MRTEEGFFIPQHRIKAKGCETMNSQKQVREKGNYFYNDFCILLYGGRRDYEREKWWGGGRGRQEGSVSWLKKIRNFGIISLKNNQTSLWKVNLKENYKIKINKGTQKHPKWWNILRSNFQMFYINILFIHKRHLIMEFFIRVQLIFRIALNKYVNSSKERNP